MSYSREDLYFVGNFVEALSNPMKGRIQTWYDKFLLPGVNWWDTILDEIEKCTSLVAILTPKSIQSIFWKAEVKYAIALNKPVVPLEHKDCDIPPFLSHIQCTDIRDKSLDEIILICVQAIHHAEKEVHRSKPSQQPSRPPMPTPVLSSPETVLELFDYAEIALNKGNESLAYKLFHEVIKVDSEGVVGRLAITKIARLEKNGLKALELQSNGLTDSEDSAAIENSDKRPVDDIDITLQAGWASFRERNIQGYRVALGYFTEALNRVKQQPGENMRKQHEIQAYFGIGVAQQILEGWASEKAGENIDRAYRLYRQLSKEEQKDPYIANIVYGFWSYYFVRGNMPTAFMLATILRDIAKVSTDTNHFVDANVALGATFLRQREKDVNIEEILDKYTKPAFDSYLAQRVNAEIFFQDSGVTASTECALAFWFLGYFDKARFYAKLAEFIASELNDSFTLAFAQMMCVTIFQLCRDLELTEHYATKLMSYEGFPIPKYVGTILAGWLEAEKGNAKQGIDKLLRGRQEWQKVHWATRPVQNWPSLFIGSLET